MLMKNLTVRHRIVGCFSFILLMMVAIGGFAHSHLTTIYQRALTVETDAMPALRRSSLIANALAEDYLLTVSNFVERDPAAKERGRLLVEGHRKHVDDLVADYERTIQADADRQAFAIFKSAYADYLDSNSELVGPITNITDVKQRIDRKFTPRYYTMMGAIDKVQANDQTRGIAAATDVKQEVRSLLTAIVGCFVVALALTMISGAYLFRAISRPLARLTAIMEVMRQGDFTQRMEIDRRDEFGELARGFNRMADEVVGLVGQVQKSGIRVSTSMTEIAATSKQQQATASEVAATTTQIGATSREISATSRELVRTMNEVSTVAEHAAGLAGSGQAGLSHMEETMAMVMEAAGSINAKLAVLNEKAGNINQVVTTITKVADQTNLLSLNAAIEAEKAGEYGRGFAVVSSEIRRLADQTAVATYDIEQMVKEIQAAVSAGVMGMDKFSEEVRRGMHDIQEIGGKLSEIITQVQALVPRFETVNEGMQAQATGAEQISEALLQLTESTQQTVESLRQSSSAIDELNQVSGTLHGSISRFKLAA
jgi:methyl-accepting chemotaxis protein WspA